MQPPFVGPSYNLESRPASVQRTVNMVPVLLEPGNERAGWGLEDVPGLRDIVETEAPAPPPPPTHGCYITENFDDGLTNYSAVSGDTSIFTIATDAFGDCLNVASQNAATPAKIRRTFGVVTATRITARCKVTASESDDAPVMAFALSSVSVLQFLPRREVAFDPSRRGYITLAGEASIPTPAALTIGDWHELVAEFNAGAGNSTYVLTDIDTATVVASGNFSGDYSGGINIDELFFVADSSGQTCPARFDSVCIGF